MAATPAPPRRRPDPAERLASDLSRRERQIMDAVYHLGRATVAGIEARLPDPPTATAVRTLLRILECKGHLRRSRRGLRNVYSPVVPRTQVNRSMLPHVVDTLFHGSSSEAMATLLELPMPLSEKDLDRLDALIERARNRP